MARDDWERALLSLMRPIIAHASPGGARVYLPGGRPSGNGRESDSLEAFARSLWMAGPWLSTHPTGKAHIDGRDVDVAAFYRRGFLTGTDVASPESWHALLSVRQTLVEACPLAWNLWLARRALWEPLSARERRQILAWLEAAARIRPYGDNWQLFPALVLTVLKLLGGPYDQKRIDTHLDRIESLYLGDGWYTDGQLRRGIMHLDYYNAWAIHPYLLYWSLLDGDAQPVRRERILTRARLFLQTYPYWFGSGGSYPCFGRSALYRMAVTAIFPAAALMDACPVPLGQARRICSLVLGRFLGTPGTLGASGQLTMGFTREYLPMTDAYSGPGSPYWAGKAFMVLALPPEHPFWTTPEEPLPIELGDYSLPIPAAGFLLHGSRHTGQLQLINGHGLDQGSNASKRYSNLAYSSHFGYEIAGDQGPGAADPFGDACLTFSLEGEDWYGRHTARSLGFEDGILLTEATYRLGEYGPSVHVLSAVAFLADQQLRMHQVRSGMPVYAREGGFACGWDDDEGITLSGGTVSYVAATDKASGIRPVVGYDEASYPSRADCNVLTTRSAVPHVRTLLPRRGLFYLASVSLARPATFSADDIGNDRQEISRRLDVMGRLLASHRPPDADGLARAGAVARSWHRALLKGARALLPTSPRRALRRLLASFGR